ncbi:glycosyltransferase family protein [Bacillus cytotoxicus]|uniref:Streptomycin biosynthesis StrF domain protein n=2 Tax=Bacillus cytotoxicus TaxID=580165 RepID=A0AAX2CEB6_9BACI|nr:MULTISPECIES: glycosyltransferase family protein [Bacillus cereus group]ABS21268.1 putative streptomycin biosynthesis StrF domain protein [Bacillus cytotoxicus NVH 391-98]AWC27912.1 streptomycin biosynthesis protein StrF [Bacillus cytotoxicus]AWC31960.1 streptomycin biosynthesis protein StrF [Bacillus cytotoxicus]AWC35993.1 streptomycin biosynthesis protein StrF [Bacillus cytotoxicus]AWC40706.1 streptomycin biosynthesis protein StrF [Bacillus cytotoxicus]
MQEKTILFVICTNNEELFAQCQRQIHNLFVPPGYRIQILPIYGAKSMTSAYNQAISHPAKYKVYLHQDTFIIDRNVAIYLIDLFTKNEKLGLIGVAGCQSLPASGIWWEGKNLVAQVIEYRGQNYQLLNLEQPFYKSKTFLSVEAIDGLFMATQYDIPWREDVFDGFHFYDISQSMEFRKAGYLIGISTQKAPWCIHYNGDEFDAVAYEKYRRKFVEHYMKPLFSL